MQKIRNRIIITVLMLMLSVQTVWGTQLLVPGGQVIGLEVQNNTVTVADFHETAGQTARDAGLQVGDRITAVDGKAVQTAQDVRDALQRSSAEVELSVMRDSKPMKIRIKPQITPDGPRLGVYLKQGVSGVGTVTWYDAETQTFGALGHGVNDAAGSLLRMTEGNVYEASVLAVKTGKVGTPGQLMSTVTGTGKIGSIRKNTVQGVFGTATLNTKEERLPVGTKDDVHTGAAIIRSTVAGNTVQEYSVEILKVYPNTNAAGRNMLLKVTDPELIAATGGIVQGMSGSPIIQDGKLIGAVTHVLVNDPTTGYGIFIENMLNAAA